MAETITVAQIIETFEQWSPKRLAFDWDKVGLQVGTHDKPVKKVMVTLDVMENVVDEAIEKQVDLIIAHHPVIFKPLEKIETNDPKGRVIKKLLVNDIAVYAAHTNLDIAEGGVNDALAETLGITSTRPFLETEKDNLIKLTVFVPEDHEETVRQAVHDAGAGHIGDYSHASFTMPGKGRFMPTNEASPYIGKAGELEIVDERRIEVLLPQSKLERVLHAMKEAHPYEEVAYDIYTLQNAGKPFGVGRIGTLPKPLRLKDFCEQVKKKLSVPALRVIGNLEDTIETVAILGGSGEKYIQHAKTQGADVYITGDLTLHPAQEALELGINVIDPGHHVEKVMKQAVKNYLENSLSEYNVTEVIVSESNTEPFQFI
ncbi:Nif3-like dinuclear metal center hexameric protein [Thalassobacillus pellis]|uniref:Nif3-like dinuclear metal center hexameric protein n=1 Tax=Thalassobacillus pellis TaxID=748008 RepID=UPI00195F621D|nr:Nif3-like dinuclear metal center hexameric protein [Thalassobacillus pellis]MBM7554744.1 dinuclear metal center YbgI/SA1388 family protein [Thalassobacillus pellis]